MSGYKMNDGRGNRNYMGDNCVVKIGMEEWRIKRRERVMERMTRFGLRCDDKEPLTEWEVKMIQKGHLISYNEKGTRIVKLVDSN